MVVGRLSLSREKGGRGEWGGEERRKEGKKEGRKEESRVTHVSINVV
jgi:hypothetical protein